jgi:hypothetical protein
MIISGSTPMWVGGYVIISTMLIAILIGILYLLNRKANIAIKKADYIEKKLLDFKYR